VPLAWIEPWARGGALLLIVLIALALWTRAEWRTSLGAIRTKSSNG
jgi:hypothetical protein